VLPHVYVIDRSRPVLDRWAVVPSREPLPAPRAHCGFPAIWRALCTDGGVR
jgi:hypothetical protein